VAGELVSNSVFLLACFDLLILSVLVVPGLWQLQERLKERRLLSMPHIFSLFHGNRYVRNLCSSYLTMLIAYPYISDQQLFLSLSRVTRTTLDVTVETLRTQLPMSWIIRAGIPQKELLLWQITPIQIIAARLRHDAVLEAKTLPS
jgi:hypothetical protein